MPEYDLLDLIDQINRWRTSQGLPSNRVLREGDTWESLNQELQDLIVGETPSLPWYRQPVVQTLKDLWRMRKEPLWGGEAETPSEGLVSMGPYLERLRQEYPRREGVAQPEAGAPLPRYKQDEFGNISIFDEEVKGYVPYADWAERQQQLEGQRRYNISAAQAQQNWWAEEQRAREQEQRARETRLGQEQLGWAELAQQREQALAGQQISARQVALQESQLAWQKKQDIEKLRTTPRSWISYWQQTQGQRQPRPESAWSRSQRAAAYGEQRVAMAESPEGQQARQMAIEAVGRSAEQAALQRMVDSGVVAHIDQLTEGDKAQAAHIGQLAKWDYAQKEAQTFQEEVGQAQLAAADVPQVTSGWGYYDLQPKGAPVPGWLEQFTGEMPTAPAWKKYSPSGGTLTARGYIPRTTFGGYEKYTAPKEARPASAQTWATLPPSAREGLYGYLDWASAQGKGKTAEDWLSWTYAGFPAPADFGRTRRRTSRQY